MFKQLTAATAVLASAALTVPSAHAAAIFVPGTGSTKPNAPAKVDMAWLDWGRYGTEPMLCLCDSRDYPAKLGPGDGQKSMDTGTESLVQRLLADPTLDEVVAGSQGDMVAIRAASDPRVTEELRRSGRKLTLHLYSDPDNPHYGAMGRFPGIDIPFVGIKGGDAPVPGPDVTVVSTSHENDPVSYFPKFAITYLWTLPAAAADFIAYHGALNGGDYGAGGINYDGAEVTVDGNRTTIMLRDPFTGYGQLAVVAVRAVAGPQAAFTFGTLIKPVDDIAAGFIALGGQHEKGAVALAPTPQFVMKTLAKGFENAAKDFAAIPSKLKAGPKPLVSTPPTAIPSTTPDLVPLSAKPVAPTSDKTAGNTTPIKVKPQVKPRAPKPSGNPVHDTIKTVQGALKAFAPKPTKPKAAKPSSKAAEAAQ